MLAPHAATLAQGGTSAAGNISLDSLLNTRISTAAKYAQTSAEAPASVTILTADDLARGGYGGLSEVLESIRGFYLTSDRDNTYLGTRGFSRPSDYNDRILLLIDGHTLNDQVWGGAPMGLNLPINLASIERIEVVRGPGAVQYGTNAMFAVINIVTRSGGSIDGVIAEARINHGGERQASVAAGRMFGTRLAVTGSMLVNTAPGQDLYFAEFDAPATNNGIAEQRDWHRAYGGTGSITLGDVSARVGYMSHARGVPTASFGTIFNDPRENVREQTQWADISVTHDFHGKLSSLARVYADRYIYNVGYPSETDPVYSDGGGSTSAGIEVVEVLEVTSRNRLSAGTEFRRAFRAAYYEHFSDGTYLRDDVPFSIAAAFAQDEIQLSSRLSLVAGIRLERSSIHGTAAAPRAAVVFRPDSVTTIKTLYGDAYRDPSVAEADITTSYYTRNPSLRPERVRTLELTVSREVAARMLMSGSL
jgi:iron complex outermembrane receptor protein